MFRKIHPPCSSLFIVTTGEGWGVVFERRGGMDETRKSPGWGGSRVIEEEEEVDDKDNDMGRNGLFGFD